MGFNERAKLKNATLALSVIITLTIVCFPRFDGRDIGFVSKISGNTGNSYTSPGGYTLANMSIDARQYVLITEYFRGYDTLKDISSPYSFRPLVPYLASLLPLNPLTSINIINIASMLLSIYFIYKTILFLGFSFSRAVVGCFLFIISFPVFYYSVIGTIDACLVCLIAAGLFTTLRNSWLLLGLIIVLGVFIKESIILLIPVAFVYGFVNKIEKKKVIITIIVYLFAYFVSTYIARSIIVTDSKYFWAPGFDILIYNLSRPRTYLSFVLTFGIPGLLTLLFIKKAIKDGKGLLREYAVFITGFVFSMLLFLYSVIAAYSDGRFVWTAYPFAIPLAVAYIDGYWKAKKNKRQPPSPLL